MVEQAIETAALLLGTDKSRGYCLEMIRADFLAGANLDNEDPTMLLQSMSRGSSNFYLANNGRRSCTKWPRRLREPNSS